MRARWMCSALESVLHVVCVCVCVCVCMCVCLRARACVRACVFAVQNNHDTGVTRTVEHVRS